jgi:hypothetical protein
LPAAHCAGEGQPASHAPQLFGSDVTSTHALPQNWLPCGQQVDCEQIWLVGHCTLHAPQWSEADVRSKQPGEPPLSTSQRVMGMTGEAPASLAAASTAASPPPLLPLLPPTLAGHVNWQFDAVHAAVPGVVPPAGGRQLVPHVPQLPLSLVRSTHPGVPWQRTFGAVHGAWHWPALQSWLVPHA